ncbi:dnaJ homolog subfamily C member 22-like [Planococcus citri]|uniref:dnaJ homolog subfamily C member 22-like n=1 Tax=Planococcus citri TaxID=170843 RepID=UPI0031F84655
MLESFHLPFFKLSSRSSNDTKTMTTKTKKKSKFMAYFWWLFGGISGFHHFYLGRDLHGFLWWATLGGYFGLGWIADLFYIGEYVAEANDEPEFIKKMKEIKKKNEKPPFSTFRFTGMILLAYFWSSVFQLGIPEEEFYDINWKVLYILTPIPCTLGIWVVGNVGQQKGGIWTPLLTAYLTLPLNYVMDESTAYTIMVLAAAYTFDSFEKQWKPKTKTQSRGRCKRIVLILGAYLIFCSFWGSYIYFNATVTDQNGDEIPVREALYHFLKSPWWTDLKQSILDVKNYIEAHGWVAAWKLMVEMSDTNGENNAYKVLELTSSASQSEINEKCKYLSKTHHPDKFTDVEEKRKAQERFFEIQQACEVLSSKRAKRRRKNKKFEESEL